MAASTPRGINYPTSEDKIKDGSSPSALADDFAGVATSSDAAITAAVQEAKDDADTSITQGVQEAKSYADTKKTEAISVAADDATEKADAAEEAAKWYRGDLGSASDLNSLSRDGLYNSGRRDIALTIVSRPPGFNDPFTVEQTTPSAFNGIKKQVAEMKIPLRGSYRKMHRFRVGGVWLEWLPGEAGTAVQSNTDVNSFVEPGVYEVESETIARSLANRPDGFNYPHVYVVRRAGSTIFQEAIGWSFGTVIRTDRTSSSGVMQAWHGASETPVREDYIAIFGDSQSSATETSWEKHAGPLLTDSTFINYAEGGDNSTTVLLRNGITQPKFKIEGGVIPASGSVVVTTAARYGLRENRIFAGGTILGVGGYLTHLTDNQYTFTRSTAGSIVTAEGWQKFTSNINTTAKYVLLWFGGNDFNEVRMGQERTIADHVIANYRTAIDWCRSAGKTPIVAGVTNRITALSGSEGFAQVQRVNRELRAFNPGLFLDVQAYYVERAIYDAGLVPTADDLASISRGEIPPQLFIDGIHLVPAAHKAIGENWIAPWLAEKGFAQTTATLPQLPTLAPADMGS